MLTYARQAERLTFFMLTGDPFGIGRDENDYNNEHNVAQITQRAGAVT